MLTLHPFVEIYGTIGCSQPTTAANCNHQHKWWSYTKQLHSHTNANDRKHVGFRNGHGAIDAKTAICGLSGFPELLRPCKIR
jgi:hypothetical protein